MKIPTIRTGIWAVIVAEIVSIHFDEKEYVEHRILGEYRMVCSHLETLCEAYSSSVLKTQMGIGNREVSMPYILGG